MLTAPLAGKITITSPFGLRGSVPGLKTNTTNHLGTDLRAAVGTPVVNPAAGVVYAYRQGGRYYGPRIFTAQLAGNWLLTWHPALGVYITYAHLQSVDVTLGQVVKPGQVIARTGNSGGVAAHLHVGVWTRIGNTWTAHDPESYFDFTGDKASAPSTPPSEEDDMYTDQDRARDDATYAWLKDVQPKVAEIHAIAKRLEVASGVHTWALTDDTAGLRRAVANVHNSIAALPGSTAEPVNAADLAAELGRRLSNG